MCQLIRPPPPRPPLLNTSSARAQAAARAPPGGLVARTHSLVHAAACSKRRPDTRPHPTRCQRQLAAWSLCAWVHRRCDQGTRTQSARVSPHSTTGGAGGGALASMNSRCLSSSYLYIASSPLTSLTSFSISKFFIAAAASLDIAMMTGRAPPIGSHALRRLFARLSPFVWTPTFNSSWVGPVRCWRGLACVGWLWSLEEGWLCRPEDVGPCNL